jgi:hypothetical protein
MVRCEFSVENGVTKRSFINPTCGHEAVFDYYLPLICGKCQAKLVQVDIMEGPLYVGNRLKYFLGKG